MAPNYNNRLNPKISKPKQKEKVVGTKKSQGYISGFFINAVTTLLICLILPWLFLQTTLIWQFDLSSSFLRCFFEALYFPIRLLELIINILFNRTSSESLLNQRPSYSDFNLFQVKQGVDELSEYINQYYIDIRQLPFKADYVIDRYFYHSPYCLINKLNPNAVKLSYQYQGIELGRDEGFEDYMFKKEFNFIDQPLLSNDFKNKVFMDHNQVPEVELPLTKVTIDPITPSINLKKYNIESCPYYKEESKPMNIIKIDKSSSNNQYNVQLSGNSKSNKFVVKIKPRKEPIIESNQLPYRVVGSISKKDGAYIEMISESIRNIFPKEDYDDGSLAPIILRLSWHCCATFNKHSKTGGSNGATMRFVPEITDEGNTGLDIARAALEPIKHKFPKISYSDLWTLAGKVAIEYMGGPIIDWKPGRYDCLDDKYVPPNGNLPFGYKDANHIRETFSRMGFNIQEMVALLGAHTLGRCHKRFSGWEGKWTENPIKFSNDFYKVLLEEEWKVGNVPETGRVQYYNNDKSLMMLNTDLELIRDEEFLIWVKIYAQDEMKFFNDFSKAFSKLLELGIERLSSNDEIILDKRSI
ncbi:heme peroxidase [Scheffersomyces coipomensis]|uniref:heme peroxidase n=1 Tax=Scheffersomyces coipomensis TaxID=1788519 RepID=UPI00315D7B72